MNKKIAELERQIANNKQEKDIMKDWKMYQNKDHGFAFRYPGEWKDAERRIEIDDFFTKTPEAGVLQLELVNKNVELDEIAKEDIAGRSCPSDHIIDQYVLGVMYVTECGAMSEEYNYIFENKKGETIKIFYHDDFDSNWSEEKKLEKFKLIIDTIFLF